MVSTPTRRRASSASEPITNLCSHSTDDIAVGQFGIDQKNARSRVLDDVLHLFGDQTEVDRDENATRSRDPEEARVQTGRVVTENGDSFADADAECIEAGGLGACPFGDFGR